MDNEHTIIDQCKKNIKTKHTDHLVCGLWLFHKVMYVLLFLQMQSLQDGEDAMLRLDHLEALYYELQLQLYDIQAEVLRCEELLLTAQLQSLRRQMTGEALL